jgi:hypothetical protein
MRELGQRGLQVAMAAQAHHRGHVGVLADPGVGYVVGEPLEHAIHELVLSLAHHLRHTVDGRLRLSKAHRAATLVTARTHTREVRKWRAGLCATFV